VIDFLKETIACGGQTFFREIVYFKAGEKKNEEA